MSSSRHPTGAMRDLGARVFAEAVAPNYQSEIADLLQAQVWWRKLANFTEGLSHVILVAATVFAFSAGFFNEPLVTFAAGCCNTLYISLRSFSSYSNRESRERNQILNRLLSVLGISAVPDVVADPDDAAGDSAGGHASAAFQAPHSSATPHTSATPHSSATLTGLPTAPASAVAELLSAGLSSGAESLLSAGIEQ